MDEEYIVALIGASIGTLIGLTRVYMGTHGGGWIIPKGSAWSYYLGNSVIGAVTGSGAAILIYLIYLGVSAELESM